MAHDPHDPVLARLQDADMYRDLGLRLICSGEFAPAILMLREASASVLVALGHQLGGQVSPQLDLEEVARGIRWFPGGVNGELLRSLVSLDGLVAQVRTPGLEDARAVTGRILEADALQAERCHAHIASTLRTHITAEIRREAIEAEAERAAALAAPDEPSVF